jgi:hypothetical protein
MTAAAGAATWRVTLTGAERHAAAQLAAVAVGEGLAGDPGGDAADRDAADGAALAVGGGFPAGAPLAQDDTAASTRARTAARTSNDRVAARRIMTTCVFPRPVGEGAGLGARPDQSRRQWKRDAVAVVLAWRRERAWPRSSIRAPLPAHPDSWPPRYHQDTAETQASHQGTGITRSTGGPPGTRR